MVRWRQGEQHVMSIACCRLPSSLGGNDGGSSFARQSTDYMPCRLACHLCSLSVGLALLPLLLGMQVGGGRCLGDVCLRSVTPPSGACSTGGPLAALLPTPPGGPPPSNIGQRPAAVGVTGRAAARHGLADFSFHVQPDSIAAWLISSSAAT